MSPNSTDLSRGTAVGPPAIFARRPLVTRRSLNRKPDNVKEIHEQRAYTIQKLYARQLREVLMFVRN
jgi:hypothetical protein